MRCKIQVTKCDINYKFHVIRPSILIRKRKKQSNLKKCPRLGRQYYETFVNLHFLLPGYKSSDNCAGWIAI